MRKLLCLISCLMLTIVTGFAQTGINTVTPKASLDVQKSTNPTFTDGIIPPRVTCTELLNKPYSAEQKGALVYVTDADCTVLGDANEFYNPSSPKWPIRLIGKSGYYTFNGTEWGSVELDGLSTRYIFSGDYSTAERRVLQAGQKAISTEKIKLSDIFDKPKDVSQMVISDFKGDSYVFFVYATAVYPSYFDDLKDGKLVRIRLHDLQTYTSNNFTIVSQAPQVEWIYTINSQSPPLEFYLTVESKDKTTEYIYRVIITTYFSTSAADDFDVFLTTIVERLL